MTAQPVNRQPLKILHVSRRIDGVGGIQRFILDLRREQARQGHKVTVLAIGGHKGLHVRTVEDNIGDLRLAPELFSMESGTVSIRFADAFLRLARRCDIIHFHYPNPVGEACFALLHRFCSAPAIATLHGEVVTDKPFYRTHAWISRRCVRSWERILVTSPNIQKSSPLLRDWQEKTAVVPLAVDIDTVRHIRAPTSLPAWRSPRVLFVGRLARYKGVSYLIDAMADVDAHLMVVGEGPLRSDLERRAGEMGIQDRVTFVGWVPDEDLSQFYNVADILVLPSIDRGEGFGYVLLEAMVNGTALITTELNTGTSFANLNEVTGLVVNPKSASELASALRRLISHPAELSSFKVAARERASSHFQLVDMALRIDHMYREVLESSKLAAGRSLRIE